MFGMHLVVLDSQRAVMLEPTSKWKQLWRPAVMECSRWALLLTTAFVRMDLTSLGCCGDAVVRAAKRQSTPVTYLRRQLAGQMLLWPTSKPSVFKWFASSAAAG
jgi:hypothetical protein